MATTSSSADTASCSTACPPNRGCLVWIDRHVHKAGGTSIRHVMGNLAAPYNLSLSRDGLGPKNILSLPMPQHGASCSRFAIEAHEHVWHVFDQWVPQLRAYERKQPCCRVVLTVRIREPVYHYISMFQWANIEVRYGPSRQRRNMSLPELFEEWAPPNLQANNLLGSSFSGFAEGTLRSAGNRTYHQFSAKHYAHAANTLKCDFDLVYPMERFSDGLGAINRLLGFGLSASQLAKYSDIHIAPHWGSVQVNENAEWSAKNADHERERQATVCPDMARCRALVERIAPFDVALYRLANELFEAHLKDESGGGASSSTRRRLRASEQRCPPRTIPARRFEQLGRRAECPCERFTDPGV